MSEDVERRLVNILDEPYRSPFGNPIPALDELGVTPPSLEAGVRVIDLPDNEETKGTIEQINEILQVDASQFRELYEAGIVVGAAVTVVNDNGTVTITTDNGATVELVDDLAHAIRIHT